MVCLDCRQSVSGICSIHHATDNLSDDVDVQIAELKRELAEARRHVKSAGQGLDILRGRLLEAELKLRAETEKVERMERERHP